MLRYLPYPIVGLLVVTSLGWGGHSPWAMLVLELGAFALLLSALFEVLWGTSREVRAEERERRRTWRRLPLAVRYPGLASCARRMSLGRWPGRRSTAEVEILLPGQRDSRSERADSYSLFGYRFRRARLAVPLLLITSWTVLSLLPWKVDWLERWSPQAFSIRSAAESLIALGATTAVWPSSLSPFLTERALCLWFAYLALFYVVVCVAADPGRVERLTRLLFVVAIAAGLYGSWQWFSGLRELLGAEPSLAGIRASGPFGNPNHYAASMEMLLLCSAGWVGAQWVRLTRESGASPRGFLRRARAMRQESAAKTVVVALGMMVTGLGLIFSLSRSGITAVLVGLAVFAFLARSRSDGSRTDVIELRRDGGPSATRLPREARHGVWALSLILAAMTLWVGMNPVLQRFEGLTDGSWAESGRQQVWLDSLGAVSDFWATGSGLSTFQHVFPIYRSFGGVHAYAYAHNDYLQILIELGLPGFLLVIWLMVAVWVHARRVRKTLQDDGPSLQLHAGYCAAVVALALHSLTDFSLHLPANAALLSLVLGVGVGLDRKREEGQSCP